MSYLSSHDGATTTLLLGESPLTDTSLVRTSADTTPPMRPYLRLQPFSGSATTAVSTIYYDRPQALWTSSENWYPTYQNNAEMDLGFEWGYFSGANAPITEKLLSAHTGGAVVSFCDSHQQFLNDTISIRVFRQLMTPWGSRCDRTGLSPTLVDDPLPTLDESEF